MESIQQKLLDPAQISPIVLFLFCLIVIPIAIRTSFQKNAPAYLRLIPIYIILIALQLLIAYYETFFLAATKGKQSIANISTYIFLLFEFTIFSTLLKKAITSSYIKSLLIPISIFFLLFLSITWLKIKSFLAILAITTSCESILLIPFCLYYFYEILKKPLSSDLSKESFFWIITAILFLLILITPFYLLSSFFIKKNPEMQIIDHLAYAITVALLTKALIIIPKENR